MEKLTSAVNKRGRRVLAYSKKKANMVLCSARFRVLSDTLFYLLCKFIPSYNVFFYFYFLCTVSYHGSFASFTHPLGPLPLPVCHMLLMLLARRRRTEQVFYKRSLFVNLKKHIKTFFYIINTRCHFMCRLKQGE